MTDYNFFLIVSSDSVSAGQLSDIWGANILLSYINENIFLIITIMYLFL